MRRRRSFVAAGVAVVAGAAGAGWAWRQHKTRTAEAELLWSLALPRPEGGDLALATLRGRPLLVNFWATWCPPCVQELPEIDRFHTDFAPRGWQVLAIAIDRPAPVREFLRRVPLGFPVVLAGVHGTALPRQLGNGAGALPFSLALAPDGRLLQRKLGPTHYDELAQWAAGA